jgi:tRNA-Thr(GGU) m(6)t(6)A37 methyltransferase TsaA
MVGGRGQSATGGTRRGGAEVPASGAAAGLSLTLEPIGVVRTPFTDKRSAPRQPAAARGVAGRIELYPHAQYEHALSDLQTWSHIWVIFWFHRNAGFRAKVLPPRSRHKRGVFATRSPHRPNPLGLSVLRLERIEGRVLHVLDVDMLDGTPVLDLKPYVPYTDALPDAQSGWLQEDPSAPRDPGPRYRVAFSERAELQLAWLGERSPLPLRALAEEVLALGPAPHPYRRIKQVGDRLRLAVKDFRLYFEVRGDEACVLEIATGYRERVLLDPSALATERTPLQVHRAFVQEFGPSAAK